jgi:L-ascorbate metabolism protein UlaG (beta-lactamase superfamily)
VLSSLAKPDRVEHPVPDEIIYYTPKARRVLCRRWTWRNSAVSKITPETTAIALNIDMMTPPSAQDELEQALESLADLDQLLRTQAKGVRWRYFGHACILVETAGVSLLFDPVLSYTYENSVSRYTYADLPDKIDYVLITHNHQDHILFETLLQLRRRIGTVVVPRNGSGELQDPSLKLLLRQVGFKNVIELAELETLEFDGGSVVGLPFFGEHADLDVRTKLAYMVARDERPRGLVVHHELLVAFLTCGDGHEVVRIRLLQHQLRRDVIDSLRVLRAAVRARICLGYRLTLTAVVQRLSARLREFSGPLTDKLAGESFSFCGEDPVAIRPCLAV